ncbi:hypothetical protein SYNPS1DRAFT_27074 [Syncephalis pseudoplumigaleata]|uniref:Uncharacterized protein n=1 Tax=Syncephalis pseudoplumigaleata TaxID=1712513 RepID=A0A4P9Z4C4_9FUNG|nr:hypothetical protein SYNPS1DRAFT_27074 [Syncephalis pseudoplumigaleata]|eukprot:RKP27268.1 hypothetical protein SYNPS1DRAFT_27074 [Syncephalis pseudoplumigaleata]
MADILNRWTRFGSSHSRHASPSTKSKRKHAPPRLHDVHHRDYTGCPVVSASAAANAVHYYGSNGYAGYTGSSPTTPSRSSSSASSSASSSFAVMAPVSHFLSAQATAILRRAPRLHRARHPATASDRRRGSGETAKSPRHSVDGVSTASPQLSPNNARPWHAHPLYRLFRKRDRAHSQPTLPRSPTAKSTYGEADDSEDLPSPTLITHIRRISLGGRGASSLDLSRPSYGPLPYQRANKPYVKNILPNGGVWLESDARPSQASHSQWDLPLASFTSVGVSTGAAVPMSVTSSRGGSSVSGTTVAGASSIDDDTPRTQRTMSIDGTLTTQVGSFVTGMHLWSTRRQPPSISASTTHLPLDDECDRLSLATTRSMPASPALTAQRLRDRPHRPHQQQQHGDATQSRRPYHPSRADEDVVLTESWQQLKLQLHLHSSSSATDLALPRQHHNDKHRPLRHKRSTSTSTCASSCISPSKSSFDQPLTDKTTKDAPNACEPAVRSS